MNEREYLKAAIIRNGNEVLLPGDIVTDNIYFPQSNLAEHWKVTAIYDLLIPFVDESKPPMRETWINVEIVRSPNQNAVGIEMSQLIHSVRRVDGKRTFADYVAERDDYDLRLRNACRSGMAALLTHNEHEKRERIHDMTKRVIDKMKAALDIEVTK